ncbi:MAG: methyltransferase domain-containing protein [Pseudonocardiales bacterium]
MADPGRLADELHAAGALLAAWGPAFRAVPRARFIPDRMWADEGTGYRPVDRTAEPQCWMRNVYADRVIVTQWDDGDTSWPDIGRRPTSSASMPSAVLGMLNVLDVQPDHRMLEIGTGTGYNAALVAEQVGDHRVSTIEVDPVLASQAHARLGEAGYQPAVICGDGAAGHPPSAPFDRVLATATVRLGELPYPWVDQTTPGGRIVVPMRTEITSGPVVVFTVHPDGTAIGRPVPLYVGFMELRAQRSPLGDLKDLQWDDSDADITTTELAPWTVFNNLDQRWVIGMRLRGCRWWHWPPTQDRPHVLWLSDLYSGSWATAAYGRDPGPYVVRQHGPRRLWDEAEAAHHWWTQAGKPPVEAWEFVITADRQYHRLTALNSEPAG